MILTESLRLALMVTGFVFIMMLLIEYVNVATQGMWQNLLKRNLWAQYFIAAVLGAVPGCLGAFSVVALYSHNVVSFGALVAAMIATSGDEAFVMFSLFPAKALILTSILLLAGITAGYVTDIFLTGRKILPENISHEFEVHDTDSCTCFPRGQIMKQLKSISFQRLLLIIILLLILSIIVYDLIMSDTFSWIQFTFIISALFSLFVVSTVPEHFLEEHLWEHILKQHIPRLFGWTFAALIIVSLLTQNIDMESLVNSNSTIIFVIAVLVGIIPESGPHMLFVTLYANGSIPFSILLANSIVQDGHGTLPLLSISKKGFLLLKLINIITGFIIGFLVSAILN